MKARSTQRTIRRQLLLGGAGALIFYVGLYLSAEPWRVYDNDVLPRLSANMLSEPWFWLITAAWMVSGFLFFTLIVILGRRWSFAWFFLLLALPAFIISRGIH